MTFAVLNSETQYGTKKTLIVQGDLLQLQNSMLRPAHLSMHQRVSRGESESSSTHPHVQVIALQIQVF